MLHATLRAALLFGVSLHGLTAEITDRIAATVGAEVIADSRVSDEIRLSVFLDGVQPDMSSENRRKVLDRLIDQSLVRREVGFTRFQGPSDADVEPQLAQIKARYSDEQAYRQALDNYGLTGADVIARLRWQVSMLRFIEYRFQPAVQVTNSEIRQEYRRQAAEWREKNRTDPPSLDEMRPALERIIRQRLTDSALDLWLGEVRTQNEILYREGYR